MLRPSVVTLARWTGAVIGAFALVACTASKTAPAEPASPPAPAPATASSPTNPSSSTSPAVGIWHLPGQVDATNLEIYADGTFAWDIDGCDFRGGDDGRWHREATGDLVLEPGAGQATFEWTAGVSFRNPVAKLTVTPSGDRLTIAGTAYGDPIAQTWERGSICPQCGGQLGPTGQKKCEHKVRRKPRPPTPGH